MTVTIRDVARQAGVSITTVSRAFNGYQDVSEETKKKILQVAESLNYRPSRVARSLVLQQTQSVGLMISDFNVNPGGHHFLFDVIAGVHDRLAYLGYDITLVSTTTARQRLISYIDFCTERRLEGVIVMGMRLDDPYMQEVAEAKLPSVGIDLPILSRYCGYVMTDNVNGARQGVRYLISQGHRSIGFVNGHAQAAVSVDRLRGYQTAMQEAGLEVKEDWIIHSNFLVDGGETATRQLLQNHPEMTAIFYASDLMAIGGMRCIQRMGKKVPGDIAVLGYDNIDLGEWVTPMLSTVAQKRYEMGVAAADMLMGMLLRQEEPGGRLLPPSLVIRESS
ncbi:LacI family DNA-binding transcriptional regulator [Alicyclobacillus tolerans]|uniref:Transcriptional regulator, LacI family n=2 Tax=Alicyclobacillus tolerans TaxID=90970 RepID=A0A1M6P1Q2_9BACL|nr:MULTISPECIES: LacI family DNA-binding transcriptional regulator [Alicyclobacillus]MDP9729151.1 DNA-binding LacI/PurR family transcriptional regulator [Alicyclobacillus tengchongensis]SHK01856.1 transcriptional regulator, LacI family [Alicyclobacillus montanus]